MVPAFFSAAVLFGAAAEAVQFKPARATVVPEIPGDGMTPKPTAPPELRRHLANRDTGTTVFYAPDNTCGFLSGSSENAYTCNDVDAQCAIITLSKSGYIGCCDDGDCGGFHLSCVDSSQFYSASDCDSSCASDTFTLKCTDSATPYCNSVSINGGASLKVYGYFCNDVAISTMQAILTTYSGETDGRSFSASLLNDVTFDSTVGQTETFGFGSTGTSTTTPVPTTTIPPGGGSSTPTPTPAPAKKSSNTGAIAGGVVGGVAGLALIGLAIFFILRRQRKNSAMTPAAGAPGAPGAAAPGAAPAAGPGGAPLAGAAVAGAAVAGSPGMQQVNTPPPQPYYDPSKTPEYAYAGQGSPQPGQQPYYQGQPQPYPPQQPYYAAAAVAPSPDRTESASPLGAGSPMHDYHLSSVSATGSSPYTGAISPQTTGNTGSMGVGVIPGQAQVPATIHEAGGNAIGVHNDNHHGEMHELA
ncbi:hypothetical protein SCUCBS95973_002664 [Sporothrix curviconia]|uniref:Uncharacterized protein n=1 Tax=Sporothrix curviconia TaxID=1260050 RepID=A0ABP0B929_9PEZI